MHWRTARKEYIATKEYAREHILRKVEYFNAFYNFSYNRISIKNQKSRWGSCSSRKNINFNFRLINIPEHLADYVVVHELCHLAELNHAKAFWDLVAIAMPDYRERRAELKKIRM